MLILNSIRLQKTHLFKDVEFHFTPGLHVIYGLNKANTRVSDNGNAAGKSFLFSSLGETLLDQPIIGQRQDAIKSGTRTVSLTLDSKTYEVQRSNNKLEILHKGKSKFRTKPQAKEWLAKLPINEEEYNTYVHVDARKPHPLIVGSSTERKQFFTSFFGLNKLDIERKLFQAELNKLGKVRAVYDELKKDYQKLRSGPDPDLKALKIKFKQKRQELDELNAKNVRLQDLLQLLQFEKTAQDQLKRFYALTTDLSDESFADLLQTIEWQAKENKKDLSEAQDYADYLRDIKAYTKAFNALSETTKKYLLKFDDLERRSKIRYKEYRKLGQELEDIEEQLKKLDSKPLPKPFKVEGDKTELAATIDLLKHKLAHATKFKRGQCETCGQDVKIVDPKKLQKRLNEATDALEKIQTYEYALVEYKDNLNQLKQRGLYEARVNEIEALQISNKKWARIYKELINLPETPQAFRGKKLELEVVRRMVEEDRENLKLLEFIQPNLELIRQLQKVTDKQRLIDGSKLQLKVNECQEALADIRLDYTMAKKNSEQRALLKARLQKMKAALADEEALKILVEGYSDKAMKKMAIKTIASRLMAEVDKYARLILPEDFSFEFDWSGSQMSILVHRKYGKKVLTSDIRKLSGAESKLFTFIMLIAEMVFVPERKRCNVLVLDEPAAAMSEAVIEAFKKLLPILNRIFPCIILITPKHEERYENCKEYTVLKTKKEIKLMNGHPSVIK